jgi:hypothetical protein
MIDNLIVALALFGLVAIFAYVIYACGFALTLVMVGSLMFFGGMTAR